MEDNYNINSLTYKVLENNLSKGKILEHATLEALTSIGITSIDLTDIYNFRSPYNKSVPDYLTKTPIPYAIECKNWNCIKYYVN